MFLENTVNPKEQFGWIEVICGSMFSGKTEELIRRLKRAQFAKQKVEIFKPNVDVRFDSNCVVSHDSNEIRSTPVPAAESWLERAGGAKRGAPLAPRGPHHCRPGFCPGARARGRARAVPPPPPPTRDKIPALGRD